MDFQQLTTGLTFEAKDKLGSKIRARILNTQPAETEDYVNQYFINVFERHTSEGWEAADNCFWAEEGWFSQRTIKPIDVDRANPCAYGPLCHESQILCGEQPCHKWPGPLL